jgi:NAD(P)H-hydrate repair Nnr-like enzyme with NAD(P)H-hydrate dehydratase domain
MLAWCRYRDQKLFPRSHGLSHPGFGNVCIHLSLSLVNISYSNWKSRQSSSLSELQSVLDGLIPRLHVLVVGPGLGRETHMQAFARLAIQQARERGLYLVLDADALLLIQEDPDIVRGYTKAVITPNIVEFQKLCDAIVRISISFYFFDPDCVQFATTGCSS